MDINFFSLSSKNRAERHHILQVGLSDGIFNTFLLTELLKKGDNRYFGLGLPFFILKPKRQSR